MSKKRLNYEDVNWESIFYLSDTSPSGIRRKIAFANKVKIDSVAGAKSYDIRTGKPHCWRVRYSGKLWQVHRIILILLGNDIKDLVVDHIDGNPFNNRIENLRIVSHKTNCQNRGISSNSKSGITGVSIGSNGRGRTYAIAHWHKNGKTFRKNFSIDDLGYDEAIRLATIERTKAIENLNLSGEEYSERHATIKLHKQ